MIQPVDWCLYFWDGTTFTSDDGGPCDSPQNFALCVTQPKLERDKIIVGADWLMWRSDLVRWTQSGADGIGDQLILFGGRISCFRKGLWLPTEDWRPLWERARRDIGLE